MRRFLLALLLPLLLAPTLAAHPVPKSNHDRTIVVRVTAAALIVDYRLETDEANIAYEVPREAAAGIKSREELLDAYSGAFAEVLGRNLDTSLDKEELRFKCVRRSFVATDHVRCEYRFEAAWAPAADREHAVKFHESNYVTDDFSRLHVYLTAGPDVRLVSVTAPDAALMGRSSDDRRPGDDNKLRRAAATFRLRDVEARGAIRPSFQPDGLTFKEAPDGAAAWEKPAATPPGVQAFPPAAEPVAVDKPGETPSAGAPAPTPTEVSDSPGNAKAAAEPTLFELLGKLWDRLTDRNVLRNLLFETNQGLAVLLLVAALAGGAHALTPGHGKTAVAAYLIGQRGTYWHAVVLGVVTTLTHTAAVIAMAAVFLFLPGSEKELMVWQGLIGGGLITALGLWLLYRRALGQADHFHIGGGHHHHHHDHAHSHDHGYSYHTHDEHGAVVPADAGRAGLWGVVMLGMSGGLLPCWDAVVFLGFAVSAGQARLGLPLILAFSAGLATVLVLLGLVVVGAKNATQRAAPSGRMERFFRMLPILSALVVTLMGLWLCREAFNPH
jgi:ABC-type nickel/cobalt efflux system permease component RcnA